MTLLVNEIFYSIQGESLSAGIPCVFVRLTGCNLRCSYCDTPYAYDEGTKMAITEILKEVAAFRCPVVEITGGEPLLQNNTPLLIQSLLEDGYEVLLETNGSIDIGLVDDRCIKIVDIKCPTSGESHKNNLYNLNRLNAVDQIKFVIGDREDFRYAQKIVKTIQSEFPRSHILFSPVFGKMQPEKLARWILDENMNVRLHLALQKIIWPDQPRGV
ncbi:MAG TPA: radical SAM protein [Desulfobacterales bacterium]|mgnify:CR=1 FL=1|nr:radical SAM protein [Desulfobacterales bacterium]